MLANFETCEARRLSFTVRWEQWGKSRCSQWSWGFHKAKAFSFFVFGLEWETHGAQRWSACVGHGCQRLSARSVFSPSAKGHLAHLDKKARTWQRFGSIEQVEMTCLVKPDKVWQGLLLSRLLHLLQGKAKKKKSNGEHRFYQFLFVILFFLLEKQASMP